MDSDMYFVILYTVIFIGIAVYILWWDRGGDGWR